MNISSRQSSDLRRTLYNQVGKGICVTATPLAEPAVELLLHIDNTKYKKYLFNVGET